MRNQSSCPAAGAPFTALLAILLAMTCAACGSAPAVERRPNVLLITVDTLRRDHLGAYGATDVQTPRIDALAAASTVFENAAVPMPMTRPSHFSILSSLYPREHGVVNNAMKLPEDVVTIPELFAEAGWSTAAFFGVSLLGENSGGTQGFQHVDAPARHQRPADQVMPQAIRWIEQRADDEPFFVWLHLFDPHTPYAPPAEFRKNVDPKLDARFPDGLDWPEFTGIAASNEGDIPRRILEHAQGLYRGEVEYVDQWMGRLFDTLEAKGQTSDTAIVFTADHGESFDHGVFFEHSGCLYDSTIRVPLIVHWPDSLAPEAFAPGERVAAQVSNIDIAPTLLELAGLPVPTGFSGRALQDSADFGERYVLIQQPFYNRSASNRREVRYDAIRSVAGQPTRPAAMDEQRVGLVGTDRTYLRGAASEELYSGPTVGTLVNRAPDDGTTVSEMAGALDEALEEHPLELIQPSRIDAEMRETLKALGYAY